MKDVALIDVAVIEWADAGLNQVFETMDGSSLCCQFQKSITCLIFPQPIKVSTRKEGEMGRGFLNWENK